MITEDYVSFEMAKLLKEKGFDEPCVWAYDPYSASFSKSYHEPKNSELNEYEYSKPTIQMAMKWLREVHKVEINVSYSIDKTSWWGACLPMYEEDEENSNMFQSLLGFDYQGKTYEEACEAAIKYCLDHLHE